MDVNIINNSTNRSLVSILLLPILLSLCGCMDEKFYLDPILSVVEDSELKQTDQPLVTDLSVDFLYNGEIDPTLTSHALIEAQAILNKSNQLKLGDVSEPECDTMIFITMICIASEGPNKEQEDRIRIVFGMAGLANVKRTDHLEINVRYESEGKQIWSNNYATSLHKVYHTKNIPEGIEPMSKVVAIQTMMEHLIMNLIWDMQADGII